MAVSTRPAMVCGRSLDECLQIIEGFHNWMAPDLVLGIFMVDKARNLIGEGTEADAIVETRHCLPDAVQLFTPCTYGNGWMKVLDWDKFALSLYDRLTREGYRVWLDVDKAKAFPNLYNWFQRRVSKKDLPLDILLRTILDAGDAALSAAQIRMTNLFQRQKKARTRVCPCCGEAYGGRQGLICAACAGDGYYHRTFSYGDSTPCG